MTLKQFHHVVLSIFLVPILASILLKYVFITPPDDYGKGSMFDLIATRYDFINRALALNQDLSWRKEMIKEVTSNGELFAVKQNSKEVIKILDLATGTADVAILMAREYQNLLGVNHDSNHHPTHSNVEILGLDPSQNMIQVGRTKISSQHLSDLVTLDIGDSRNLSTLKDNTFHAVTMAFGIRNVPEKEVALCEIHRVLLKNKNAKQSSSSSSKLAILEFSEPESGIMGYFAKLFIRHIVPIWGAILSGKPREYMHLQNSIQNFPSPTEFASMMEGLQCGKSGKGSFHVEKVIQLNFGSVQIYVATPIIR